jgi:peptidoglycan/LPS O-acetylase OafA/YrhL
VLGRLRWIDQIKGIALLWIFLNHSAERIFGYPYMANPNVDWPALSDRIHQLAPIQGHGVWDFPLNLLRYVGWAGDQGVQLFLVVSGFGITWGILSRSGTGPLAVTEFYRRRLARIFPLWWAAHLGAVVLFGLLADHRLQGAGAFVFSMLGIRVSGGLFYYLVPSWWFIGLILQIYLFYPIVWEGLRRLGPLKSLFLCCAGAFVVRGVGLLIFEGYLDPWQRGAVFVTRLPEFVVGASLAWWMFNNPPEAVARLKRKSTLGLALAGYAIGTVLSFSLIGMTVAPFLLGAGAFVVLYVALGKTARLQHRRAGGLEWIGLHSYSLYLVHEPAISLSVPRGLPDDLWRIATGILAAAVLTFAAGLILERVVIGAVELVGKWRRRIGATRIALIGATVVTLIAAAVVGVELGLRWRWPQEASRYSGWGERPSLVPDPDFGWRLRPSTETRLRWESYDYTVTTNSLGFPGPEYPPRKAQDVLRIMTTGDAFTSAEGVDTEESWPRVLERQLEGRIASRKVEVMNFAVTGYGPNQYAAVVDRFGPVYRPDLVIIGFFVNDYQDVLDSYEDVRRQIGFSLPRPDDARSVLHLSHLRHFVEVKLRLKVMEHLRGRPSWYGYFLGNFKFLERGDHDWATAGRERALERLSHVADVAEAIDAGVAIAMIPAPVQVCGPDELEYYPSHVDLEDRERFDLELPQRMTREIAEASGFRFYDLLPLLESIAEDCPYQPHNMHWTEVGHFAVGDYLARVVIDDFDPGVSED